MMWLSQVTLLRVTGHVLAKVDVTLSAAHKAIIEANGRIGKHNVRTIGSLGSSLRTNAIFC
jgi:hypothetical protein